tara:strand:+ start:249 stop:641 length:393 start_codon:yes stop_codon:yes gene_type:complete
MKMKIQKLLIKTVEEHWDGYKNNYDFYILGNRIMMREVIDFCTGKPHDVIPKPEELFWTPDKEFEGVWCFISDGGTGWDLMSPDSDYNYYGRKHFGQSGFEFQESLFKNFEKAGLLVEKHDPTRYNVYKN